MANYTIELRSIIEGYAARVNPKEGNIRKQIELARPFIFDFDYYIFDEKYRKPIEENILASYAFQEIAHETVAKWQFYLENWFINNFEKYNKLYEAQLLYGDKLIYDNYSIDKSLTDVIAEAKTATDTTSNTTEDTDAKSDTTSNSNTDSTTSTTNDSKTNYEGKEVNTGNIKATDVVDSTTNAKNTVDVDTTNTTEYKGEELVNDTNDTSSTSNREASDVGSTTNVNTTDTSDTTNSKTDVEYKGSKSNEQKGTRTNTDLDRTSNTKSEVLDDSYEESTVVQTGATEESYEGYINEETFSGRIDTTTATSTSEGNSHSDTKGTSRMDSNTDETSSQSYEGLNKKSFNERKDVNTGSSNTNAESDTVANTRGVRDSDSLNTKEYVDREDSKHATGLTEGRVIAETQGKVLNNTKKVADTLSNLNTLNTSNSHNNYIAERYGWTTAPVSVLNKLAREYMSINQMIIEDISELFMQIY